MGDLFSTITEDIKPLEDFSEIVLKVSEFVKNLDPVELRIIRDMAKERSFDDWDQTARRTQTFAYGKGLKSSWWESIDLAQSQLKGEPWSPGWDAAMDYIAASLLKPWVGTSYSSRDYDFMTAPLRAAGFN